MRRARLEALSAGLEEMGCEALLVLAPSAEDTDLAPFLPGPARLGGCFLVLSRDGEPRLGFLNPPEWEAASATGLPLLTPEDLDVARLASGFTEAGPFLARVLDRAFALCGLSPGRMALAGGGPAGVIVAALAPLAAQGWIWVPGHSLVLTARKRKEPAELAGVRAAAEGTCEAMRAVARLLAAASYDGPGSELWLKGEPLTVARIRSEVVRVFLACGLEQPRGNHVAVGEQAGLPHSESRPDRVLRAGEPLMVDLFPRGRLFADCTRTFCVGEPPVGLAPAHALVRSALEEAYRRAAPGVRGWTIQEAVCALLGEAGFSTPVHDLGHGVGFDLHEFPSFTKAAGGEGVLREGDVFAIEPGLYDPGAGWGVRLEDLVYLGPDGPESLTPLPYEMDPRAYL